MLVRAADFSLVKIVVCRERQFAPFAAVIVPVMVIGGAFDYAPHYAALDIAPKLFEIVVFRLIPACGSGSVMAIFVFNQHVNLSFLFGNFTTKEGKRQYFFFARGFAPAAVALFARVSRGFGFGSRACAARFT